MVVHNRLCKYYKSESYAKAGIVESGQVWPVGELTLLNLTARGTSRWQPFDPEN